MSLQIMRSDPVGAHGFAPGEIMLGRKLVYPCELEKTDIDFNGTNLTTTLVDTLNDIRKDNFGVADSKIKKYQKKYQKKYDKVHKVKPFSLKKGEKVQVKRIRTKKAKGGKSEIQWTPRNNFYTLRKIDKRRKSRSEIFG